MFYIPLIPITDISDNLNERALIHIKTAHNAELFQSEIGPTKG